MRHHRPVHPREIAVRDAQAIVSTMDLQGNITYVNPGRATPGLGDGAAAARTRPPRPGERTAANLRRLAA